MFRGDNMEKKDIPVVILAGGLGMRMRDYSENLPKALVPIGNMPVLLHVMKIYSHYGFNKFIICLGHKGEMIKEYFMNHEWILNDMKLETGHTNEKKVTNLVKDLDKFEIIFADTGLNTPTGGRLKKIERYIDGDNFLANYCDGLSNVNVNSLLEHHLKMKKIATLTAIHPLTTFGLLEIKDGLTVSFKEKPILPGWVNGGYFAFNRKIFDYLDENSVLEEGPLRKLSEKGQLAAFQHDDFWACMDTYKDVERLNKVWEEGWMPHVGYRFNKVPWKVWEQ